jgi:hypothetical protein
MPNAKRLFLYEELTLLALRNEEGTFSAGNLRLAVAGAVLAELLLERRIAVDDSKHAWVELVDARPTGEPILDECLATVAASKKKRALRDWMGRVSGITQLDHKVARQLCDRGILRADEDKVLLVFTRRIYPEVNPIPEKEIVERLRGAIFSDSRELDPRTVVLVSLAHNTHLLPQVFGQKEIRQRKKRIEQIVQGEVIGKAAKEVIAAVHAAVFVCAVLPAITTH